MAKEGETFCILCISIFPESISNALDEMESQYAPLSEACAKTLWDKTYDKRKIAATEIEKQVLSHSCSMHAKNVAINNTFNPHYPVAEWS